MILRKPLSLLCSALLLCAGIVTAAAQTAVPADKADFDLFLLIGQSNMAGRGALTDEDRQPVSRVLVFNQQDHWAHQGEPIHFDKPKVTGVGLGFTFGKLVAENNPNITVGLIPCAVGGTPIARWKPGGDLFEEAVRRAKIAQQNGTLKGILWHQGESECGNRQKAESYGSDLAEVIEGFRKELNAPDVPVVVGELGEYLYTRVNAEGKRRSPFAQIVNEQIRSMPSRLSNIGVALSADLTPNSDILHFNAQSLKIFGLRYYEVYRQLADAGK